MSTNVIATIPFLQGQMEIIDFPTDVKKFAEFPDGRFLVLDGTGRNMGPQHFIRIDTLAHHSTVSSLAGKKILDANIQLLAWVKDKYGFEASIGGKSLERALVRTIHPAKAKGRPSVPNAIYGVSRPNAGSIIEMRMPRGISMLAYGTGEQIPEIEDTKKNFVGNLKFVGRKQRFRIGHNNQFDWCDQILAQPGDKLDERVEEASRYLPTLISPADTISEMRYYFEQAFPWAATLLGDITIDSPLTLVK
jgi:hypothetical protein